MNALATTAKARHWFKLKMKIVSEISITKIILDNLYFHIEFPFVIFQTVINFFEKIEVEIIAQRLFADFDHNITYVFQKNKTYFITDRTAPSNDI